MGTHSEIPLENVKETLWVCQMAKQKEQNWTSHLEGQMEKHYLSHLEKQMGTPWATVTASRWG